MTVSHLEILVEEESMAALLRVLVPMIAPGASFDVFTFDGKAGLLRKLPQRLAGYSAWAAGASVGIVVVVDRDDDDCTSLKRTLVDQARGASLSVASAEHARGGVVLSRIAVEELEAWLFGDVDAIAAAYPGVPTSLGGRAAYRDPDAIRGGTWEALERVLHRAGHHRGGLQKVRAAQEIARHMDVERNQSVSFQHFRDGVRWMVGA
ncbi:MAG: DUF4276 family protein [Dermatophilaceae bacterium]